MNAMLPLVGRGLLIAGIAIALAGAILILFGDQLPRLGRLPGDLVLRRSRFTLYLPLGTSLLLSVVLSALLWLVHLARR